MFAVSLTPESVRWLMLKGKAEEAKAIFRKLAKVNKRIMPDEELQVPDDSDRLGDARDLFRTRTMAQTTLLSWYCW